MGARSVTLVDRKATSMKRAAIAGLLALGLFGAACSSAAPTAPPPTTVAPAPETTAPATPEVTAQQVADEVFNEKFCKNSVTLLNQGFSYNEIEAAFMKGWGNEDEATGREVFSILWDKCVDLGY
jgi:CubicO group peptidase (beta-lactamase class C family)